MSCCMHCSKMKMKYFTVERYHYMTTSMREIMGLIYIENKPYTFDHNYVDILLML